MYKWWHTMPRPSRRWDFWIGQRLFEADDQPVPGSRHMMAWIKSGRDTGLKGSEPEDGPFETSRDTDNVFTPQYSRLAALIWRALGIRWEQPGMCVCVLITGSLTLRWTRVDLACSRKSYSTKKCESTCVHLLKRFESEIVYILMYGRVVRCSN